MKRGYYLLCLICVFLISFNLNVSQGKAKALEDEKKTVYQSEEITDIELLFENAKKGNKMKSGIEKNNNGKALLKGDRKEVEVEVVTTKQLLRVEKKGGNEERIYVETVFPLITSEDFTAAAIISKDKLGYDDSRSWTAYSKIYYSTSMSNGKQYAKLSSFYLEWKPIASGINISNRRYKYANNGQLNGTWLNQVSSIKYTTSNTVSSKPPVSWKAPEVTDMWAAGVNMYATLSRSTSTWEFVHYHSIGI